MDIQAFWTAVLKQNADAIRSFFRPHAQIAWHNTNELFTVDEFIRANCEYPGYWDGEMERVIETEEMIITAVHVYSETLSFHVTSFIRLDGDQILSIDEYWGDDGPPPQWRQAMGIGQKIR